MSRIAFIFPGQGSQIVGMGKDFSETYPEAKSVFEQANDILGINLSDICFNGDANTLNDTINTQPALYVCSVAILKALETHHPFIQPVVTAGHSLGEFTALTAAKALSFEDGLRLVRERGRLMQEAGEKQPGAMAAILGLQSKDVHALCRTATSHIGSPVVVANDNCPGQVVISGDVKALKHATSLALETGAKRAIQLAVSIAAHSPLMESAAADFRTLLEETTFNTPQIPVYANASATPISTVEQIRDELNQQLTQPVRWTESIQAMIADENIDHFIEIGSGDVLTGLIKRIDRSKSRTAINTVEAFQQFINHVK